MLRTFGSILVLSVGLFAMGCSVESGNDDGGNSEDDITGGACGKAYGEANALYKEAVAEAKAYNGEQCGGSQELVAEKMSAAVRTCAAFGDVYKNSQWAAPVRTALEGTFVDGILRGESFDQAIVGAYFESGRPGVGPALFQLTFGADTVEFVVNDWDDETGEWTSNKVTRGYSIARPSEGDEEMLGWRVTIDPIAGSDAEPIQYRLRYFEERDAPTWILQNEMDEEAVLYSYADRCSA